MIRKLMFILFCMIPLYLFAASPQQSNSIIIPEQVGPEPYFPDTADHFSEFDYQDRFVTWPNNIWWVPLEISSNSNSVTEAIVSTVVSPDNARGYEVKIGTNQSNLTDEQVNIAKSVGKLIYTQPDGRISTCTATHVGNGHVVTAGHCISDPRYDSSVCANTVIVWDYRRSREDFESIPEPTVQGQCLNVLSWEFAAGEANTIDHAILKVDNYPDSFVEIDQNPSIDVASKLHQFAHPGGSPLLWSASCDVTNLVYQYYQHNCWSASGSSGSALIDANTNKLVGVLSMGRGDVAFTVRNDHSPIGCLDITTGLINPSCQR